MKEPLPKKETSPKAPAPLRSPERHARDPLHGITLADMLYALVERLGWEKMGSRINIRCFLNDPSIKSSLTFLRRTPWARTKVEELYLETFVLKEEEPPRSPKKLRPSKAK